MKLLKSTILLLAVLGTVLGAQSCNDKGECDGVVCQNGGACVDGACDCPDGYMGTNCEDFDPNRAQALLDAGKTPLELFDGGVPLENLYGKMYQGGLIFYLNTTDGKGLVAATADAVSSGQAASIQWGCFGDDITGLNNVTSDPKPTETEAGARIEDGAANTDAIVFECPDDNIAAKLCRDRGVDWFLPSRGELYLMYTNLHQKGLGNFSAEDWYWSSTEVNGGDAWDHSFYDGFQNDVPKENFKFVRAARAF